MKKLIIPVVLSVISIFSSFAYATDILVYDANFNPLVPLTGKGDLVLNNGKKTLRGLIFTPADATQAYNTLRTVIGFYQTNFNRNSFDDRGTPIEASVRVGSIDLLGLRQNAAWVGNGLNRFVFGKGGDELDDFTQAIDVVAHEYTHAIVQTTSALQVGGQSGALNESFADIMGETIQQMTQKVAPADRFLIGETVLTPAMKAAYKQKFGRDLHALRDMLHPELGLEPQPGSMKEIAGKYDKCVPSLTNDQCGVHMINAIPNRAAALIMQELGVARTKDLFYNVMTRRLQSISQFVDFARELRSEAAVLLTPAEADVVNQSLITVGL